MLINFAILFLSSICYYRLAYSQTPLCETRVATMEQDVCPQKEGRDLDCSNLCSSRAKKDHLRVLMWAQCNLRSDGILFKTFGIRSFVCQCCLGNRRDNSPSYSRVQIPNIPIVARVDNTYSSTVEPTPQLLVPIDNGYLKSFISDSDCSIEKPIFISSRMKCDIFGNVQNCAWKNSKIEPNIRWYSAKYIDSRVFRQLFPDTKPPEGSYLIVHTNKNDNSTEYKTELHSCPIACTDGPLNVTVRFWKQKNVKMDICFKELGEQPGKIELCTMMKTIGGNFVKESIPEATNFTVYIKINGMKPGEIVLLDDIRMAFRSCKSYSDRVRKQEQSIVGKISSPKCTRPRQCLKYCRYMLKIKGYSADCGKVVGKPGRECRCIERVADSDCRHQKEAPFLKICQCNLTKNADQFETKSTTNVKGDVQNVELEEKPCIGSRGWEICKENCRKKGFTESACRRVPLEVADLSCNCEFRGITRLQRRKGRQFEIGRQFEVGRREICDQIQCGFENFNLCSWQDLGGLFDHFSRSIVIERRADQTNANVPKAVQGTRYLLARLPQQGQVGIMIGNFHLSEPFLLQMQAYRSSKWLRFNVCTDRLENCAENATFIDLDKWHRFKIFLPKNTKRIYIVVSNEGSDWGAIGIDEIELLKWTSNFLRHSQSAC